MGTRSTNKIKRKTSGVAPLLLRDRPPRTTTKLLKKRRKAPFPNTLASRIPYRKRKRRLYDVTSTMTWTRLAKDLMGVHFALAHPTSLLARHPHLRRRLSSLHKVPPARILCVVLRNPNLTCSRRLWYTTLKCFRRMRRHQPNLLRLRQVIIHTLISYPIRGCRRIPWVLPHCTNTAKQVARQFRLRKQCRTMLLFPGWECTGYAPFFLTYQTRGAYMLSFYPRV